MEKSRVCMSRTINLAKKKCPSKMNLLVYETSGQNKPNCIVPHGRPPLSKPSLKRIKICTGAQLKKVCRPPPCPVSIKKSRITILGILGFGLKCLFVASLVYYSCEAGLWGDSEEAEMFYTNFCYLFEDPNKKEFKLMDACEIEMEFRETPPEAEDNCKRPPIDRDQIVYRIKEMWNHTICSMFAGLVGLPGNLIALFPEKEDDCPKK